MARQDAEIGLSMDAATLLEFFTTWKYCLAHKKTLTQWSYVGPQAFPISESLNTEEKQRADTITRQDWKFRIYTQSCKVPSREHFTARIFQLASF